MKLGILIPYYKNSEACEVYFKKLMTTLVKQTGGNIFVFIYEDGQVSKWIYNYGYVSMFDEINHGISYSRNYLLDTARIHNMNYIMFLDSDDMIDCDFVSKMYEAASTGNYDMITSRFIYNKKEMFYPKRCNVAGICLRTEFIKGITFDEDYNISEDTLFINEVYDRNPRIGNIDSNYYYNYGVNENSLMMRFERSEIGLMRSKDEKEI